MKDVILKRVVAISLLACATCCHAAGQYEDRWFYVSRNLTKQEHVREIAGIVKTAKAADLNGMLLAPFGELVRQESAPSVKVQ